MIYRFADCELDTARFELRRAGVAQKIEPQVYEILCYLVERHGQFVSKNELYEAIWQGRIVSDAAVSSRIKAARRAIGDNGVDQQLIRTIHGRGFSFVASVIVPEHHEPPREATSTENEALLSADIHLGELLYGGGPVAALETELLSERALLKAAVEKSGGRVVANPGGGITAQFGSAVAALECAAGLQAWRPPTGPGTGPGAARRPRMGIVHPGDDPEKTLVMAARLQCRAAPGQICITGKAADCAHEHIEFSRKAIDGGPGHDAGEVGLYLVEESDPATGSPRVGIPQLQCGSPTQPREPSIVLLPFEALGSDPHIFDLAEGLRIDIQNGLVKIARIVLIAAGSANAFRGKSPDLAARSLGVRYVLHGVVQGAKEHARVFVELIDTLTARGIWAEQFNLVTNDSFTIQDEITRKVIAALDIKLYSGEQARIWHKVLADPDAVRVFYRGVRLFFRMERESMSEARRAFEAVAEMRPESSIGATWAALCYWFDYLRRWSCSPSASMQLAKQWAEAASALPDADGQAHTVLAHVRLLDREFEAALEAGRQALLIRPGCANANGFFGNVLHYCGEQTDAITHIRKGIRLQPVYPPFFASTLAIAYLAAGQTESASAVAKEALRLNSSDLQSRFVLVAASQLTGSPALARVFAEEMLHIEAGFSVRQYCNNQPYRDPATIHALVETGLAAGLPAE